LTDTVRDIISLKINTFMANKPFNERVNISDPLCMPKTVRGLMEKQRQEWMRDGIGPGPINRSSHPSVSSEPSEPWFPAVVDWYEEFVSKRRKTLLILGGVIGLIVGVDQHASLIFTALCVPFGIVGMILFIGLLGRLIPVVMVALILGLVGGILFLVRAAYHYF
jgi:hypothetical protein